ncbi:hypothetical protein A33M_4074 [Rhodovulum sp. PH10]|nr:hypothetical protein A33M_4074 [Rhodovulum sp. PH10]
MAGGGRPHHRKPLPSPLDRAPTEWDESPRKKRRPGERCSTRPFATISRRTFRRWRGPAPCRPTFRLRSPRLLRVSCPRALCASLFAHAVWASRRLRAGRAISVRARACSASRAGKGRTGPRSAAAPCLRARASAPRGDRGRWGVRARRRAGRCRGRTRTRTWPSSPSMGPQRGREGRTGGAAAAGTQPHRHVEIAVVAIVRRHLPGAAGAAHQHDDARRTIEGAASIGPGQNVVAYRAGLDRIDSLGGEHRGRPLSQPPHQLPWHSEAPGELVRNRDQPAQDQPDSEDCSVD